MLLEDMLVIDAATLYPRYTRGGSLYSLDIIDGATIKPLIGEDGRSPEPPDPAYQQILHGVSAADFSADELLYLPRNVRAHRLYGMSPVEQIALTVKSRSGATPPPSTIIAPVPRPTRSPRSPRSGRPTRSASSRIISTR